MSFDFVVSNVKNTPTTQLPALLAAVIEQCIERGASFPAGLTTFVNNVQEGFKAGIMPLPQEEGHWLATPIISTEDGVSINGFEVVWSNVGDKGDRPVMHRYLVNPGTVAGCLQLAEKLVQDLNDKKYRPKPNQ